MLLAGKVALVTGGASTRGIGRETARVFAQEGARVAIVDRDEDGAKQAAAALGDGHLGLGADVADEAQVGAAVAAVVEQLGPPTVVAAIAGVSQPKRLEQISQSDYDFVTDVSLRGSLLTAQAVVPHMRAAGEGALVFMSSMSAKRGGGIFGGPHYSAAKGGVMGLTRALARDLAPEGIRVNAVAPALIDTDITGGQLSEERLAEIISDVPLGRLGTTNDVAKTILFLASDLASYVTGEVLDVTGGAHIG